MMEQARQWLLFGVVLFSVLGCGEEPTVPPEPLPEEPTPPTPVYWSATASLNEARWSHTASLLPSGQVLVVGGLGGDGSEVLASAELYEPSTGTWSMTGKMIEPRVGHTATVLPSGQVLVTGGHNARGTLASSELYEPATGTWTSTGNLSEPRASHTAGLLPSGKVLIVGGRHEDLSPYGSVEEYEPAQGTWSLVASMPRTAWYPKATVLPSGKVLITGQPTDNNVTGYVVRYAPDTGSWQTVGAPLIMNSHTCSLLPSGKVLCAGGYGLALVGPPLSQASLYDEATNSWKTIARMGLGRASHTATVLPSGHVLVLGGSAGSEVLDSAELYEPDQDLWTEVGRMSEPRSGYTATVLRSGQVLVAGGRRGTSTPLAVAELWAR
ncbi:Kelch repeat-containing protein [Hyalangium rubrum]|uniref:Kelch repeat-containing protein n=1 Tax=Hyalangium rubrum TaxID=3103134 RepID=A0ABU5H4C5_9BACT|nr:kelch repeat-containing protein [Hyalangium sp. s54d21]MDY7226945.1 kelch repeat-containing protein [Hyalangium sp. s54d21]